MARRKVFSVAITSVVDMEEIGIRTSLEEGFFFGSRFGGLRRRSWKPTPVGRRFFFLKPLRWLTKEELEINTRWKKVFLFEVASVADEGGAGNQPPLEEGFSF
jgi:hypothetical protein